MNTVRIPIMVALLAGAIGFASTVRSADQPTWRVDSPTEVASQGFSVVPLSDGGAIILSPYNFGHNLPTARYAWHLDAELQLHPQALLPLGVDTLGEVDTPAGPLLIGEHTYYTPIKSCKRAAGAIAGRELRLASNVQRDFDHNLPFVDADGRFGRFAEYEGPHDGEQSLRFLHSDHDCTPEWQFDAGDTRIDTLINLSDGSGALALMGARWEPGEAERTRLVRLDRNGVVWDRKIELEDGTTLHPYHLARLPGDDVLVVAGHFISFDDSRTVLQRFEANGQLRWSHTVVDPDPNWNVSVDQILVHDETALLTFKYSGYPFPGAPYYATSLVAIDGEGQEISRQPLDTWFNRIPQAPQRRSRPLYVTPDFLMETTAEGRLEAIGPRDGIAAELADGRFVRTAMDPARVLIQDEMGMARSIEIPLPATSPSTSHVNGLRHGDRFGVVDLAHSKQEGWLLRVFDVGGDLLWTWTKAQAEAIAGANVQPPTVHADETRVCMMLDRTANLWVACFDRSGGAPQGPVAHVSDLPNSTLTIQLWFSESGIRTLRFDSPYIMSRLLTGPNGPEPEQPIAGLTAYWPIPDFMPLDERRLVVAGCEDECRTRVVDVDGELVLDLPLAWSTGDIEFHRAPNGFLMTTYVRNFNDPRRLEIERVDLANGLVWHQTIVMPTDVQSWNASGNMLRRDGRWIHALTTNSGMRITGFEDADGSIAWSQNRRLRGKRTACFTPALHGPVGLLTQRGQDLDVDWLDPLDGSAVGASAFADVGVITCPAFTVGDTGTALSAVGIETREVLRIDPPAQPTEAPDIAWLRGVWYDPGSSGQGFMFQHYPDQELMSGAWFTYASDGEHDRADQRWYTLQAPTSTSDSSAVGTIFTSEGGRFGEPPVVGSQAVGSVEISMLGCNRALLAYRFDDPRQHGQQGTMLLQRLVADAPECEDAPNSAVSPSGSYWYDPATSGQGLYLQNVAGRAFGAWFTFDPDGSADDPTAQHWFTLVGDAPLPDGRLPARIVRTIGGSLDDAATSNAAQVGQAWLSLIDCGSARLDYDFNDPRYAAAFEGQSGTLMLQRIGGCGAPVSPP